jgi:hypothetical protein
MRKIKELFLGWGFPYKISAGHLLSPTTSEAKWEENRLLFVHSLLLWTHNRVDAVQGLRTNKVAVPTTVVSWWLIF